jgi:hypothetical protein
MRFHQFVGAVMPIYQSRTKFPCRTRFGPSNLRRIPLPADSENRIQAIDIMLIFRFDGAIL